jgi:hypothetical protein
MTGAYEAVDIKNMCDWADQEVMSGIGGESGERPGRKPTPPEAPPLWAHRRSRWATSAVTFGPVGRMVASLLLLLPLWWFINYAGVFGLVGAVIWILKILPWGLRDVWRPVRVPANEADVIRARAEMMQGADTPPDAPSINERPALKRW